MRGGLTRSHARGGSGGRGGRVDSPGARAGRCRHEEAREENERYRTYHGGHLPAARPSVSAGPAPLSLVSLALPRIVNGVLDNGRGFACADCYLPPACQEPVASATPASRYETNAAYTGWDTAVSALAQTWGGIVCASTDLAKIKSALAQTREELDVFQARWRTTSSSPKRRASPSPAYGRGESAAPPLPHTGEARWTGDPAGRDWGASQPRGGG